MVKNPYLGSAQSPMPIEISGCGRKNGPYSKINSARRLPKTSGFRCILRHLMHHFFSPYLNNFLVPSMGML